MTELRKRMIEDMRIRNLSSNTQKRYVNRVAGFAKHFGKSPDLLGEEHIRQYMLYLIRVRKLSSSSINVTHCALKFLYTVTLHRPWTIERIPYSKRPKKLPVVLSGEEVAKFLESISNQKYRVLFTTVYAAGLRISEAVSLKLSDIDSKRMVIRIDQGKGKKDRYVMLSPMLLTQLREYWKVYRTKQWLFESASGSPIAASSAQAVCRIASAEAGLGKRVTPHVLRHCFATHLLEANVDLRKIQMLLGHRSLSCTARYAHIASNTIEAVKSPLDSLPQPDNGEA